MPEQQEILWESSTEYTQIVMLLGRLTMKTHIVDDRWEVDDLNLNWWHPSNPEDLRVDGVPLELILRIIAQVESEAKAVLTQLEWARDTIRGMIED